jgi:hypothetical protein
MKWKAAALLVLLLNTGTLTAQNLQLERKALRDNTITLKKTTCVVYNDGIVVDSFFSASTTFNKMGYPLQHTIFKKNSTTQGKFISEYAFDSLETKETAFDSTGAVTTETNKQYDAAGHIRSMTVSYNNSNKKQVSHFFETDSIAHTIKDYSLQDGEKKLRGLQEFSSSWQLLSSTYYDSEGKPTHTSAYEYDPANHTTKDFSVRDGIKELRSQKKYTANNFLTEEIHYYQNNVTFSGGNGPVQNFKKGDTRKVLFIYNSNGLLQEQQESVNGQITMKLQFEYIK